MTAIMDVKYTLGPPGVIFTATRQLCLDLAVVGLKLQPAKLGCYIADAHQGEEWTTLRGDIPEGVLISETIFRSEDGFTCAK